MVEYTCEKCAKVFKQKGHYDQHKRRKNTCVVGNGLDALIEQKVEEKVQKLLEKTKISEPKNEVVEILKQDKPAKEGSK